MRNPCKKCDYYRRNNNTCQSKKCSERGGDWTVTIWDRLFCKPYKYKKQPTLCRECDDYAGDGMYCASNYIVYDFSTSREHCEAERRE